MKLDSYVGGYDSGEGDEGGECSAAGGREVGVRGDGEGGGGEGGGGGGGGAGGVATTETGRRETLCRKNPVEEDSMALGVTMV
jgi:hypothetical protein